MTYEQYSCIFQSFPVALQAFCLNYEPQIWTTNLKFYRLSVFDISTPVGHTLGTERFDFYNVAQVIEDNQIDCGGDAVQRVSHQINYVRRVLGHKSLSSTNDIIVSALSSNLICLKIFLMLLGRLIRSKSITDSIGIAAHEHSVGYLICYPGELLI